MAHFKIFFCHYICCLNINIRKKILKFVWMKTSIDFRLFHNNGVRMNFVNIFRQLLKEFENIQKNINIQKLLRELEFDDSFT